MGFVSFVHSLRKYKLMEYILDSLSYYKLDLWYYRLSNLKNNKRLNDMASEYYSKAEVKKKIVKICSFLADDESVEIYKRCVLARKTGNYKYLPKVNTEKIRNQYFDQEIMKINKNDVMIDGGAWLGDTFRRFFLQGGGEAVAFEPSDDLYRKIRVKRKWNVKLVHAGLWNESKLLKFDVDSSLVVPDNHEGKDLLEIVVKSIDEMPECRNATFIKMDVEGSELQELKGAYHTIKRNHPKLAICIYHSEEDMVDIPIWLYENFPDYKFYIRHYSHGITETVIYAV